MIEPAQPTGVERARAKLESTSLATAFVGPRRLEDDGTSALRPER
ncbi:MAG: hypothetical protein ACRD0O_22135 [Acidimicrobiia bacterium]